MISELTEQASFEDYSFCFRTSSHLLTFSSDHLKRPSHPTQRRDEQRTDSSFLPCRRRQYYFLSLTKNFTMTLVRTSRTMVRYLPHP